MTVQKASDGRRFVEVETEIPGTPEEVWQAIATGPGISAWFVPSTVEEREGGKAVSHFAADGSIDSVGTVTRWDPPRRFAVSTEDGPINVATEWTVEARGGGQCVVRVVHSWFASSDDWDDQFEGHAAGWLSFFRILRHYLADFAGAEAAAFQVTGVAPTPLDKAWSRFTEPLGLLAAAPGDRIDQPSAAPPLAGRVEQAYPPEGEILISLSEPAPGLAHFFPMNLGGKVYVTARLYLYGEDGVAAAPVAEERWREWMTGRFPETE